jgi:hypothetical protein
MINYWHLGYTNSQQLWASRASVPAYDVVTRVCQLNEHHRDWKRTWQTLAVEVTHNRKDEKLIWTWAPTNLLVHESILSDFRQLGFTGYLPMAATIRFRDGSESNEYRELVVTGWAGMTSPESRIHLVEECPGCGRKKYSALTDPLKLIDWNQWTGDDFFIVWPRPLFRLVSERVVDYLKQSRIKSFRSKAIAKWKETNGVLHQTASHGICPSILP